MSLWGNTDVASNSVLSAPAQVNLAPTRANANLMYGNTTADAFVSGKSVSMVHINNNEMNLAQVFRLASATPNNAGSGASYIPGETLTIANTSGAAQRDSTLTITSTKVRAVVATAGSGTGYANGDTVTCNTGVMTTNAVFTVTTGGANSSIASLALTTNGVFTTNPTLNTSPLATLTGAGSGGTANVSMGLVALALATAGMYTTAPNTTANAPSGGSGTGATLALSFVAGPPEAKFAGMTGWALRTEGSGGRAGRVHYECLVAGVGGESANGTSDDVYLPQ
jgi:hypothetical protein